MKITRRYGTAPAERGCGTNNSCPDVLALENGDFVVIGKVPRSGTVPVKEFLKHAAGVGTDENAVIVPRDVMLAAARQIAQEMSDDHA
jgi:hypothetical protein